MTRTITTVEELDALPLKTIVMDAHQRGFQKFTNGWEPTGIGQAFSRCATPATVLYEPGEQEPRPLPDLEQIAKAIARAHRQAIDGNDDRPDAIRKAEAALQAALPEIEAAIRAQVATEIRDSAADMQDAADSFAVGSYSGTVALKAEGMYQAARIAEEGNTK